MAPTIKWQRWDSASYNWLGQTATDALPSVEAELDAWITTVNGNASNTGRQITKERGYADSTGGSYAGLVISAGANNNTEKGYLAYASYSSSSRYVSAGNTFIDDTSNNGYGTVTGGTSDTSISWYISGQEANFMIVTGTTDGQEYFCFCPSFGTSPSIAYQDGFTIFKCTDGEWSMTSQDAASQYHMHYWGATDGWHNCSRSATADSLDTATTTLYGRYLLKKGATGTGYTGQPGEAVPYAYAAAPEMLVPSSSSTYYFTGTRRIATDLGDGTNVYILTSYYYGPSFLVDLRP